MIPWAYIEGLYFLKLFHVHLLIWSLQQSPEVGGVGIIIPMYEYFCYILFCIPNQILLYNSHLA